MSIDTKHVSGRRALKFNTLDDALRDAEQLASGPTRSLGNWSFGQALRHLAIGLNMAIDGATITSPWLLRTVVRLFYRKQIIHGKMTAGIVLPQKATEALTPGPTSTEEGLELFRRALARFRSETQRAPHALLGKMTLEEWEQFQLRHAELHLSFIVPA